MSNRMTMADLKKRAEAAGSDDDDDAPPAGGGGGGGGGGKPAKPAQYYTGSGQNVQDPKKKGGKDAVDDIMKQKGVDPSKAAKSTRVQFWKNGFTVADGELRSYDTAEGKVFMAHIMRGQVPPELNHVGNEMDVSVDDKRGEDYVAPPYRAFGGSGAAIGAAAPPPSTAVVRGVGAGAAAVTLDASAPSTSIKVRLASGKTEVVTINTHRTVGELQALVARLDGAGGKAFVLRAGFPPKPLDVSAATIEAAGLVNASVQQVVVS